MSAPFAPPAISLEDGLGLPHLDELDRSRNAYSTYDGKPIEVPETFEAARAALPLEFVARYLRRRMRPEWFRVSKAHGGPDPRKHVHVPVPPDIASMFARALSQITHVPRSAESLFVWWHPLYQRWAVWEAMPDDSCVCIFVVEGHATKGELPADLQHANLEHMRGRLGPYRRPVFADFHQILLGWHLAHTAEEVEGSFHAVEKAVAAEAERQLSDQERDVLRYYARAIWHYNDGHSKQQIAWSEPLAEKEKKTATYVRHGVPMTVPVGGRIEAAILEDIAREREEAQAAKAAQADDVLAKTLEAELRSLKDAARRSQAVEIERKGRAL